MFYGKRRRTYLLTSLFLAEFAISAVCLGQTPVEKVFTQLRQASLEKSPEVKLARSTLEQKRASLYSSWTGWMPRLDFHVSQNTSKDYSFSTSGSFGSLANLIRPQETTIYAYNLEVRAPLFQRSVQLAVVRGYAERDLALTQLILKTSEVSWNLRSIFGAYLLAAYKASTVARSLKIAQANLQEAQLRFRLGQRTVIDVLKAQANLALLEARQSTYDSDQVQAMGKLVDYTGLNEKEIFE